MMIISMVVWTLYSYCDYICTKYSAFGLGILTSKYVLHPLNAKAMTKGFCSVPPIKSSGEVSSTLVIFLHIFTLTLLANFGSQTWSQRRGLKMSFSSSLKGDIWHFLMLTKLQCTSYSAHSLAPGGRAHK